MILFMLQGSTLDAQSGMPESDYHNALNHVEMDESGFVFAPLVVLKNIYSNVSFFLLTLNLSTLPTGQCRVSFPGRAACWVMVQCHNQKPRLRVSVTRLYRAQRTSSAKRS